PSGCPGRRGSSLEVAGARPPGRSLRARAPYGSIPMLSIPEGADHARRRRAPAVVGEYAERPPEVRVSRGVSRARWRLYPTGVVDARSRTSIFATTSHTRTRVNWRLGARRSGRETSRAAGLVRCSRFPDEEADPRGQKTSRARV